MKNKTFNTVGILLCCLFAIGKLNSQPIPQNNDSVSPHFQQSFSQTSASEVSVDKIVTPPHQF